MSILKSTLKLTLLDQVSGRAKRIGGVLGRLQKQQLAFMAPMRGLTGQLLAFGGTYLGVTRGIEGTIGSALKFEDAFADVRKVIDGTDEQMDNIKRSIIGMSKELPTSANGIAAIYAAAGQANIPLKELNKFAEMTAKVSVAWDTTEGETGQALAEIKNQLNLTVSEVGLFADALNHLSNKSAASAPRLLEFSKRVAANGEMFGFSSEQSLAFGGAMIASGSQAEVAATSFRNMGKALTKGERATKAQRVAFKKLGLDSVKVAKNMQKDALKTTLNVIDKIQALPEWQRISIASALFGDEARGLQPIISNATELRRQLSLVGDETQYAGSAFNEYIIRASTVGNTLAILKNKFADVFRGLGDDMLPSIKEAALGIGNVLDTLGERATIFDDMSAAWQGFAKGFGIDGDMRSAIDGLGDFFFGEADGASAADRLGKIFAQFEKWGASIRSFTSAVEKSPIAKFMGELAGQGFSLAVAAVGISLAAGAVTKLAKALFFLSGAKAAVGVIKAVGEAGGILGGSKAGGKTGKPKVGGKVPGVPAAAALGLGGVAAWMQFETFKEFFNDMKAPFADATEKARQRESIARTKASIDAKKISDDRSSPADQLVNFGKSAVEYRKWQESQNTPMGNTASPLNVLAGIEARMAAGRKSENSTENIVNALRNPTQRDVRVVNPQPPNVTIHAPVTINEAADPASVASAVADEIGAATKEAIEASYSD